MGCAAAWAAERRITRPAAVAAGAAAADWRKSRIVSGTERWRIQSAVTAVATATSGASGLETRASPASANAVEIDCATCFDRDIARDDQGTGLFDDGIGTNE